MARFLMLGLSAVGALAAATGVVMTRNADGNAESAAAAAPAPAALARTAAETVCIASNVRLVEGMSSASCLTSAQYEALRDRPVIDGEGAPVVVSLAGPDATAAADDARTCAEYDSLSKDGWYALSNADMRRSAYFDRACAALSMLVDAKPATSSNFAGGRASEADVKSLARAQNIGLGEVASAAPAVSEIERGVWKLSGATAETMVIEIAHADFTGDGVGEILAYVSTGAVGGSARSGAIGLMEKAGAGGPCTFNPR